MNEPEPDAAETPPRPPHAYRLVIAGRTEAAALKALLDGPTIDIYARSARDAHEDAAPSLASPNHAREHDFCGLHVPELIDAVRYLQSVVGAIVEVKTPGGLRVLRPFPTCDPFIVHDAARNRILCGCAHTERPVVQWLDLAECEKDELFSAVHSGAFHGGFWQAWETAMRAETETAPLPGMETEG